MKDYGNSDLYTNSKQRDTNWNMMKHIIALRSTTTGQGASPSRQYAQRSASPEGDTEHEYYDEEEVDEDDAGSDGTSKFENLRQQKNTREDI